MRVVKVLVVALAFTLSNLYVYNRGLKDGEQFYKQSRRMYFALKSAYHYGYMDGHEGKPESWDGPELHAHCSNCLVSSVCMANVTEQDIQAIAYPIVVTGLPHQPRWITQDGKECN